MANIRKKYSSSVKENLISSLTAINDTGLLTYLIQDLNKRKISNEAEALLIVFLCAYDNPKILIHPQRQKLRELCQKWLINIDLNPKEMLEVLKRPQNGDVWHLYDDLVDDVRSYEKSPPPDKIMKP